MELGRWGGKNHLAACRGIGLLGVMVMGLMFGTLGQVWAEGGVTLNLKGADLETLIETVSKVTGKNFILDPKVTGKVTVVSQRPVSSDELYQIFLSILEVHGFMAVPSGHVIKIIPDTELKHQADPMQVVTTNDAEVVSKVFVLKYVDAGRLLPVLRPMISPQGNMAAHPDSNSLVVTGRNSELNRLEKILYRVDRPFSEKVEKVELEHATAKEVVRIVQELERVLVANGATASPALVADERTNSILLGGQQDERLRMRMMITQLDSPVEASGNTRVIRLHFAKAEELAKVVANIGENYLKANKQEKEKQETVLNVQPYEGYNALVISAPPELLKSMEEVIRQLDQRRDQVQVEAIIAEVSSDKAAELGVQWGLLTEGKNQRGLASGVNFPSANPSLIGLAASVDNPSSPQALSTLNNVAGLVMGGTDGTNLIALLRALKSDVGTNILSTPTVVTLDNEEAEIIVGNEVPFITSSSTTNAGNPFQTITRENVGLSLKVKPQINQGDTIRMDIIQEVSSLVPVGEGISLSDAMTRTRRIKTAVLVDNKQILVLGGLIQDDVQHTTAKVPFFGDLPIVGMLFRSERSTSGKTNLMVFLRPHILRNSMDGLDLTGEKYDQIRRMQAAMPPLLGPVDLADAPPQLPEWTWQLKMTRGISGLSERNPPLLEDLGMAPVHVESSDLTQPQPEQGVPSGALGVNPLGAEGLQKGEEKAPGHEEGVVKPPMERPIHENFIPAEPASEPKRGGDATTRPTPSQAKSGRWVVSGVQGGPSKPVGTPRLLSSGLGEGRVGPVLERGLMEDSDYGN